MAIDPASILDKEDMERERTPEELAAWWDKKNREFADSKAGHNYALLRNGLAKKFYEEIYPLNLLANILFPGRSDIKCIPNLGNDNFDAIICDYSKSPNFDLKVEFTHAIDGRDENLRMEYLIEHGHVSPIGPLSFTGTKKTGHKISVEFEMVSHNALLDNNFALIKNRAEQKSRPKNYGKDHILVITIDDYIAPRYGSQEDIETLNKFIKTNVINLPLDFDKLYILGFSGKTFLTYEIAGSDGTLLCYYPPEP